MISQDKQLNERIEELNERIEELKLRHEQLEERTERGIVNDAEVFQKTYEACTIHMSA